MAFFDDVGKKISDATKEIGDTTKNYADITRLNAKINNAEREIDNRMLALGRMYYEEHKNDTEGVALEQIKAISNLFLEIEKYRTDIKRIKGAIICPNCGNEESYTAQFCTKCGAKLK